MGLFYSLPRFGRTIYCDTHCSREATGFCLSHKRLICMACIAEKSHFSIDCKVSEIAKMSHEMKECFIMKQEITKTKKNMAINQRQTKMFQDIEKAYSKSREDLEKMRLAHYEVARQEITNMTENEAETLRKLYRAIDYYKAGKKVQGDNMKKLILMENFGNDLVFQKVNPAFTAIQTSLEKVKEIHPVMHVGRLSLPRGIRENEVGSDFVGE